MNNWQQALHHFHALTGHTATVHRSTDTTLNVTPGTWWSAADEQSARALDCVKVSPINYAVFAHSVDKPLRDALTWMLCSDQTPLGVTTPSLSECLHRWLNVSDQQLIAAYAGSKEHDVSSTVSPPPHTGARGLAELTAFIPAEWAENGYLLWLNFGLSASNTVLAAQPDGNAEDPRAIISDIIAAFVPRRWREWWDDGVLLWVADDVLAEYTERDDDLVYSDSGDKTQGAVIRHFASDLLQVLEEDALVTATVVVSQKWGGKAYHGASADALLASLVLAWRAQRAGLRRDRVAVFGEQTLVHAVQAMTQAGKQMLADMSGDLAATTLEQDELTQTLQAMMDANLNVSEAARVLFVHRNTLIHRLDRIRDATGRDLRRFDDAAALWMSLLAMRGR